MRRINEAGLAIIRRFEGVRLKAYLCPANVWTIGYGHTHGVTQGMEITLEQAETLLRKDLRLFEMGVANAIGSAPTSDNEFSAFVSLSFNIGVSAFKRSTALKRHIAGNKAGAADAILLWNKAGGIVLKGLVRRREAERELYLTVASAPAVAPATELTPITSAPAVPGGCLVALLELLRKPK